MGDALAHIEAHLSETKWQPHHGHRLMFEHPYLVERGAVGAITASPAAWSACEALPERIQAGESSCAVVALLWLNTDEWEFAEDGGLDGLEERWKRLGHSI